MIIYTNRHPTKCANDIAKQDWSLYILHYQKILSAVHKLLDDTDIPDIKPCSVNSPDVLWVRNSKQHYEWLFDCMCQLMVLHHKYSGEEKKDNSGAIMALARPPHNLLNHGWADPYSPDQKPYRKPAVDVWRYQLLSWWNTGERKSTWPQGQPEWIEYSTEKCGYVMRIPK